MQTDVSKVDREEIINIIEKLPENKLAELKQFLSILIKDTTDKDKDYTILDLAGIWKDRDIDPNHLRNKAQGI